MRIAGAALAVLLTCSVPASGTGSSLTMLDQLEPGRWEIRERSTSVAPVRVCVAHGQKLIQLRHPDMACERYVVQDTATEVVVQYTCKGRGYGRTQIRKETNRLVQIDTRGIAGGLPFELVGEARRIGECN
ncbi:MAG: hypothetical protein J0M19_16515 [Sphingomonadales bacterium]|nr:hypothetical protein [Sphingomonadales bacterium]